MADGAASPAAPAAAEHNEHDHHKKPEKPDQDLFNERLAAAEKDHDAVMKKYNAIKDKINLATPNRNKDAPTPQQKRRQELIAQANEIRNKQGAGKSARNSKMDQIKKYDEQLRSRITEQKTARGKVNFKSVEDLDREIERLDKQVSSGMMKLVDEKKALAEISSLKKQRKNFAQFDAGQKGIDELKAKIKEIKDSMDDPEARALSDRYTKIQTELDQIKAEQDEAYKGLNSLRDERSKLHAEQQQTYQAIKKLKDEFYSQRKAFQEYEREARNRAFERRRAEREKYELEKKKERAQRLLQEASEPAYLDEIRRATNLLVYFDPSSATHKESLLGDHHLAAAATRKVDDSNIKGTRLVSKKDNDDEYMPAVKKGKKGKKGGAAAPAAAADKGFNCPPSVIDDCASMGIDPPMNASEVPAVIEKVKAKLDHWKADQQAQTQKNVDKANKEIERLEAEEASHANGEHGINGDHKKEDHEVAAATEKLQETKLEETKA